MSDSANIQISEQNGTLVAELLYDSIDYLALEHIKRAVDSITSRSARRPLMLDLSSVKHVSSLVMGALLEMLKQFANRDQRLMLIGMNPRIRSAFAVTRIEQLFEIHDDLESAMAALRENAWQN